MQNAQGATSDSEASRILADAILTFTKLLRAYADTGASTSKCDMTSGCNTSPDNHALISDAVLELVQRGWPLVAAAAEQWAHDEVSCREFYVTHFFISLSYLFIPSLHYTASGTCGGQTCLRSPALELQHPIFPRSDSTSFYYRPCDARITKGKTTV